MILFMLLLFHLYAASVWADIAETALVQGSVEELVTLEIDLSASNSTLLSIPLDTGTMNVGQWLVAAGLSPRGIHAWNAQEQRYVPLRALRPGEGFLLARGPGKVSVQGRRIVADSVELPLGKGWNLIGVPYETEIPLTALRITVEGKTESYASAAAKKWVGEVKTLINGSPASLAVDKNSKLEPWHGYWFYAYRSCILHIPSLQAIEKSKSKKTKSSRLLRAIS
jgi:hypothetical protein